MELILLNLTLAVVNSFIAGYIALTRHYRRARFVMVLLIGASLWSYGYSMEMYFTDLSAKLFWANIQLIGVGLITLWPLLVAHLVENRSWSGVKGLITFSVVPLLTLLLAATNSYHGLILENVSLNYLNLQYPLIKTYGLAYKLFMLYGYSIILSSTVYAGKVFIKKNPELRVGMLHITLFLALPLLSSFYFNFISNGMYVDFTPALTCVISLGLLVLAPAEFRIGDIMPLEYANILGQMEDIVILADKNNLIIHMNPAARHEISKEFGIAEDDLVGRSLDSLSSMVEVVGSVDDPSEIVFNGRCFDVSVFSIKDWRGNKSTLCCILREVTERRNLENKLRLLHYYGSSISKAQCLEDVGSITANALKTSLGFSDGLLILTEDDEPLLVEAWGPVKNLTCNELIPMLAKLDQRRYSRFGDYLGEIEYHSHCEYSDKPMMSVPIIENDSQRGAIVIFGEEDKEFSDDQDMLLDIFANHIMSALHGIEHDLVMKEVQNEEIQRILEGAGRVANIVRHDLRSPLQTIRNAAYIIHKDPSNEKMIGIINESIEYMVKIIEDLVYTENVGHLDPVKLNLNTLIQQSLGQMIKPQHIEIVKVLSPDLLEGQFDKVKIQRMLDNLIKNAIEAMPNGGTLTITSGKIDSDVYVSVKDTGVGVKDVSKLFTPFHTTKLNGMGLGLISVKQTVEAHNGSISVESINGKGTTFIIRFPVDDSYTANITTILSNITAI